MYLFVYKTTHTNGKYYIGRHQTSNINDGYLGSGNWVRSIKDKSTLRREIIAEANSLSELIALEEHHIALHYGKPGCMNFKRASIGLTSEDVRERVSNGTHHLLSGEIQRKNCKKRIEDGTFHLLDGKIASATQLKRVEDGTHSFLGGDIQREHNRRRLENGTHPFLNGRFQTEQHRKRVENGTHNFLGANSPSQQKWTCPHCNKSGKGKGNFTRYHGNCGNRL